MTKKKTAMRKKTDNNTPKLKVYKVDNVQKKEEARTRREKNIQTFLLVLIIILAIAAVFSAIQTFFPNLFGKFSLSGELAAKVNGKPITMKQLDTEYDRLPLQYKYYVTKELFLEQLINEVLLTEEAARQGLSVSEGEIDQSIEAFLQENNVTSEELADILKEKSLTYAELRNLIKNQLLIDNLLEQIVKDKINISTAQALQYYNDNPSTFRIPELVTARHILIGLINRTEEEAAERADMVLELVKNDTERFCSYVWLYTDDAGSAETCGEYTFPRGQMVEEFENKAFEQSIGEISLVKTDFGYHILQTINKTPEQLIPFKNVQEQIILILEQQQEKILYSDFIVSLREQANIVNYLEKNVTEEPVEGIEEAEGQPLEEEAGMVVIEEPLEPEEVEEPEEIEEITVPEEEAEEIEEAQELEEEITEEQEELEEDVEEAVGEVIEEEAEEAEEQVVEETVEEPEEPEEVPPAVTVNFAQCLTDKGAVLYGAYWDSSTKKQGDYFGADFMYITYVECGVEGDYRAQEQACEDAGILAYPTWIINDAKHMGIYTAEQLAALTGCEI